MIAGSETGMVHIDEAHILERGRLGPGEMIGVNLAEGRIVYDAELKSELAGRQDWANGPAGQSRWTAFWQRRSRQQKIGLMKIPVAVAS